VFCRLMCLGGEKVILHTECERLPYEQLIQVRGGTILSKLRVLIADDQRQVRRELRSILPLAGNIDVVGEAADGREALRLLEALRPQVVILDLQMPGLDGYQAATQIKTKCPSCRVVVLTIFDDEAAHRKAAESGADAFVVKGASISSLIRAIAPDMEAYNGTHTPNQESK
jgi:DNA-binding NarL/FixJ family response regulator